ncbi:hypothetical protein O6R05_05220 [Peptoniphilus equinus]|uniref:Uncharacterized protein n=1 Tax=Peptoniphilus equinus TaxID=3016343 RepID=A0ABY7QSV7_9FIRM|nr:hypothetical protein [Peptoniphilus equinus]WBW49411.1 hypothetical protein O6R05_05220 [Peptoniphilus equinus]
MKHQTYLIIENIDLPLPDSYSLEYRDIEADTGGETEAGTIQRDIVRHKVASISVEFSCSPKLVKILSGFTKKSNLKVKYLDTETLELKETQMYIDKFQVKLIKDTSYKGLWEVSFHLEEY